MAIGQLGRAKTLALTAVGSQINPTPPSGPLTNVQDYTVPPNAGKHALAEFTKGTSRVVSHYRGMKTAFITVLTADMLFWSSCAEGQKYTNVILTCEGAVDSSGLAVGGDITATLSEAVITEVGELQHGNEDSAPVVASITFTLSRHPESSADPTFVIALVTP